MTAPKFLPIFAIAFPKFTTTFAPCFNAFLAPITIVVIIPATEIATADRPNKFSFAHYLIFSNLTISDSSFSCLIIETVSSSGLISLSNRNLSTNLVSFSASLYQCSFCSSVSLRAFCLQWSACISSASIFFFQCWTLWI